MQEAETLLCAPDTLPPLIQIRSLFWLEGEGLRIQGRARGGSKFRPRLANQASDRFRPESDGNWSGWLILASWGTEQPCWKPICWMRPGPCWQAQPLTAARIALGRDGSELVVIQKGDMLWRAFRSYGEECAM